MTDVGIKRLNLGDGGLPIDGYEGRDVKRGDCIFPLPDADGSVDEIRASHVLEHFGHRQTLEVLKDWARALKPGGILKVAVPNFDYIVKAYADGTDDKVEGYLMGGHVDGDDRHGAIFNRQKLEELFKHAGLGDVREWTSEITDCASLPVSLNLMGEKSAVFGDQPLQIVSRLEGVRACMSMPRLAFTENMFSAIRAIVPLGITMERNTGVFWGQCMDGLFKRRLEDGTRYILTIDYDTVFTSQDVAWLYAVMEERPDVDAVCAMQCGRDRDSILLTIKGEDGVNKASVLSDDMAKPLLRISTGHFGLTMIRVSALAKMPTPWFAHHPDETGHYGEKRVDDDIHFWRGWEKAGNTLYQCNRVVVGHLQQVVTWPNHELKPTYQFLPEWQKSGKPAGVWQ